MPPSAGVQACDLWVCVPLQEKGRSTRLHAGGAAAAVSCLAWLAAYIYGRLMRRRVRPTLGTAQELHSRIGPLKEDSACCVVAAPSSCIDPSCTAHRTVAGPAFVHMQVTLLRLKGEKLRLAAYEAQGGVKSCLAARAGPGTASSPAQQFLRR